MLKSSKAALALRDPRLVVRIVLGTLLLANIVVALIVFKPWAASAEELERQVVTLQKQVHDRQAALERTRALVSKIETARAAGDEFLGKYFVSRRRASSNIVSDLNSMAQKAGIKQKEITYAFEPIEGTDTLSMITVNANYEGTFADLMHFANLLDRSEKLLIIESLAAAPQQSGLTLNVAMKLNGFVREGVDSTPREEPAAEKAETAAGQPAAEHPAAQPPAAAAAVPPPPAQPAPAKPAMVAPPPPQPNQKVEAPPRTDGSPPPPDRTWRALRRQRQQQMEKEQ